MVVKVIGYFRLILVAAIRRIQGYRVIILAKSFPLCAAMCLVILLIQISEIAVPKWWRFRRLQKEGDQKGEELASMLSCSYERAEISERVTSVMIHCNRGSHSLRARLPSFSDHCSAETACQERFIVDGLRGRNNVNVSI